MTSSFRFLPSSTTAWAGKCSLTALAVDSAVCTMHLSAHARYGDPLNAFGDHAAMQEYRLLLRPGGVLLVRLLYVAVLPAHAHLRRSVASLAFR